ncbi:MAG: DNA-directed RNA polymerase subunit beta [Bacteroidales bacterium]|nr:DNA-directed RNA polymerase subunit beta [Bacteroidales bacterium]
MVERKNFGKLKEVGELPDLIEIQTKSYKDFLQMDVPAAKRRDIGLQAVFKEVFPIESYYGSHVLDYVGYEVIPPKTSWQKVLDSGESYQASLRVKFRLKSGDAAPIEEEVYMGEIPLITEQGTFIINGAERVIVSQLHRSPGICFEQNYHTNGSLLYSFRIIPDRGSWVEVAFDTTDILNIYLDRKKRRRKFLATTFLRALGYGTDEEILGLFYTFKTIKTSLRSVPDFLVIKADVVDQDSGTVVAKRFETVTKDLLGELQAASISEVEVVDTTWDEGLILKTISKDRSRTEVDAAQEIYSRLRPGDPPTPSNARAMLKRLFFDPRRYDLGRVGRYKIQQKLGQDMNDETRILKKEDFVYAIRYLIGLKRGEGTIDDIDHLGSRRVRTVGELVENQCRTGLARTERMVRERMTVYDSSSNEPLTPQKLINPKALAAVVRDFFGRSQLSQFMDQTNPLAELTHKRRLSALGPGGLSRERAGFEVRDVHSSHYGRICPIETPEGPNIGLISSLSMYARVNAFGFIETPYRRVIDGQVTDVVDYLMADQEESYVIAQANAPLTEDNRFAEPEVDVRVHGEFAKAPRERVQFMDVSPKQVVSVAAGLIPFLEHDDANRALMGANMQRQAVPLLQTEAPYVATGIEGRVARDSRVMVIAKASGTVAYVSATKIIVSKDGVKPTKKTPQADYQVYELRKFTRSNASTCVNQHPIVALGDKVNAGDVLADGPLTAGGELSLGRNVLAAFMPWGGYNFEDAILINEKVVAADTFTSIHIEEYECIARDTKLGPEEITRDIPNAGEAALKNLDMEGVIRVGAEVKPGDILVGKITPKSETELTPEEKLLRAIFGEKAAEVRDTSLTVPSGIYGIVMKVKTTSREASAKQERANQQERKKQEKDIQADWDAKHSKLTEELTTSLSNILLGEKIPLDVVRCDTGEIIIPQNRKITKMLLRKLAENYKVIAIDPSPIQQKISLIINEYLGKFDIIDREREEKIARFEAGGDADSAPVKQVKVYLATKKKLSVGDKMSGRHGNKGVVARVLPEEDMPFLPDGTPVDIVLNPLGVPSRMNVGQVLETHLGIACRVLGFHATTPVFDGCPEKVIWDKIREAVAAEKKLKGEQNHQTISEQCDGKTILYDGRTGEPFEQRVVVGIMYMLKLHHLVSDKIHARAVGPYSLVTQQPLGGKAQYGGQRFGEMEVWALEAYGAAYALQEILTVKSDDIEGRTRIYESIVKGENVLNAGTPESFNVLMKEIQSLALDIRVRRENASEAN